MRRQFPLVLATAGVALAGCEHGSMFQPRTDPPSLVPVSQVVNAIKCELAQTFEAGRFSDVVQRAPDAQGDADDGTDADIKGALNLSNVVAFGRSGEAGFEVVPLGITFGPSISRGRTTSTGQAYELKFSYDLKDGSSRPEWCDRLKVQVEGDPFILMLEGVKREHGNIQAGEPRVKLGTIGYTTRFELKDEESIGAKVKFLVFALGGKATNARTEGQTLTLLFDLGVLPAPPPP